jgi:hypothetical protein
VRRAAHWRRGALPAAAGSWGRPRRAACAGVRSDTGNPWFPREPSFKRPVPRGLRALALTSACEACCNRRSRGSCDRSGRKPHTALGAGRHPARTASSRVRRRRSQSQCAWSMPSMPTALSKALALFAPNALGSDCDYRHARVVTFSGKQQISAWLRKRFADDDHLRMARVLNENASQPAGVLAVDWALRTSRTLRRRGFARGIVPKLSAKVVFTRESRPRIRAFANGPVGGDPSFCQPK